MIMDAETLKVMERSEAKCSITKLTKSLVFKRAASGADGSPSLLNCDREIVGNTNLHVKHGTASIVR